MLELLSNMHKAMDSNLQHETETGQTNNTPKQTLKKPPTYIYGDIRECVPSEESLPKIIQ